MTKAAYGGPLEQVSDVLWRIPKSYRPGMRVDGLIYADREMIDEIRRDQAPEQVANVAHLPGIQRASLALPDIHWGYGFCIGGVCATDPDQGGVISPGGVGYDINCGVRLVRTNLEGPALADRTDGRTVSLHSGRDGPRGKVSLQGETAVPVDGSRPRLSPGQRAGDRRRYRAHRSGRPARRRRPGPGQRAGPGAGSRSVRFARFGKPLSGSAGRGRDLRPRGAWKRAGSRS